MARLPSTEARVEEGPNDARGGVQLQCAARAGAGLLLPAPAPLEFDRKLLLPSVQVRVAPDDTGRDDPTLGTLVALSPEEVVI